MTPAPHSSHTRTARHLPHTPMFRRFGIVLLVLCACLTTSAPLAGPIFPNPVRLLDPYQYEPVGLVASDLNGDGRLDLVTGLNDGQALVVLLGHGDGTFATPIAYDSDKCPFWPAIGDFNEDGIDDVAAPKFWGAGIDIFLGLGDGSLGPPTEYGDPENDYRTAILIGDFNEDGHQDLINEGIYDTELLLGNGDGTFVTQVIDPQCGYFGAVADFNLDGLDDCAVGGAVYLGNGDTTFADPIIIPYGSGPHWTIAADVNQDTVPDIVVSYEESEEILVHIGNGDGSFLPEQRYPVLMHGSSDLPSQVAAADLNRDGLPDLLVTSYWDFDPPAPRAPSVSVLLGTGGGLFSPAVAADQTRYGALSLAVGDFDGDGNPDLARPCYWCDDVDVLLGKGDGEFVTLELETVGDYPSGAGVADFDGDGRLDLAVANTESSDVSVLLADGAGTFAPQERSCVVDASPPCPAGTDPTALVIGEMTGDIHPDVAVAITGSDSIAILAGDGAGGLAYVTSLSTSSGMAPSALALGDLNNDDHADLVVVGEGSRRLGVFMGNGDGSFGPPPANPGSAGTQPAALALGRLDADPFLDLVVANVGSDDLTVLLGDGDGTFTAEPSVVAGSDPRGLALEDLGSDGVLDLVVVNAVSWDLQVFQGMGDGSFASPTTIPFEGHRDSTGPHNVVIEDFDGDGHRDVAATTWKVVAVFPGNDDGSLGAEQDYGVLSGLGRNMAVGDFNLDGRPDLAIGQPHSQTTDDRLAVSLNQSGPGALSILADRATVVWPAATGALSYDVYRGLLSTLVDTDEDGLPDSGYGSCMNGLDDDTRDTFFVDPALPPDAGSGFFYLISIIDAQGDGGLGTTSAGLTRLPELPCP